MTHNIGSTDRIIRLVVGLLIIVAGVYFGSWWGAVGLVLLATAAVNWCPLYALVGMTTGAAKRS